jgi:hypothetical protein
MGIDVVIVLAVFRRQGFSSEVFDGQRTVTEAFPADGRSIIRCMKPWPGILRQLGATGNQRKKTYPSRYLQSSSTRHLVSSISMALQRM